MIVYVFSRQISKYWDFKKKFEPCFKVSRDDPSLQTIAAIAPRGATGREGGNHWICWDGTDGTMMEPCNLLDFGWTWIIWVWMGTQQFIVFMFWVLFPRAPEWNGSSKSGGLLYIFICSHLHCSHLHCSHFHCSHLH